MAPARPHRGSSDGPSHGAPHQGRPQDNRTRHGRGRDDRAHGNRPRDGQRAPDRHTQTHVGDRPLANAPSAASGPTIRISEAAEAQVVRGHPWVWRDAVVRAPADLEVGSAVIVEGPSEGPIAQGLWDPHSPIAVRVHALGVSPALDDEAVLEHIMAAVRRRRELIDPSQTTAYRLCYGEGDRVPGFVLDRYGCVVVARLDGAAAEEVFDRIAPNLYRALAPLGVQTLARRNSAQQASGADTSGGAAPATEPRGRLDRIIGEPPPESIDVRENGMIMRVDLVQGQKTGAFLDQRDNRARVRAMANGRRVLNLFSYAGGFSIAAALGGASDVTSVDIAHRAHLTAQQSVRANGLDPARHQFVTADVYSFLEEAVRAGHTWDLVVSDPPSFAHSEKARARAVTAYRRLHRACAAVVAQGGILCAASCSSHVDQDTFLTTLDDRSLGRSDLCLVGVFGLPGDHPTTPAWSEGRYLKFAILR